MAGGSGDVFYPSIYRRIQAALVDSIIFATAFFGSAIAIASVDLHGIVKAGIVAFLIFLLEPVLVSTTGATIGHRIFGIRVQNARHGGNLDIFRATLRFVVKALFGLPSFLWVLMTKRHQAFHDLMSHSVVTFKDAGNIDERHLRRDRSIEESDYLYPSRTRRVVVIVLYVVLSRIVMGAGIGAFVSGACVRLSNCDPTDNAILIGSELAWLVLLVVFLVAGWRGRLIGARRRLRDDGPAASNSGSE